jgi:hypothetical protein
MIPEYKLYHGAVLADIVDRCDGPVAIRECVEPGRLLNYVLDDRIGLQIKYSTARLGPWSFSFSPTHVTQLQKLRQQYSKAFVVLVCGMDGFAPVPGKVALAAMSCSEGGASWLRVARKKREMYRIFGPDGEIKSRFHTASDPIAEALLIDSGEESDLSN